jgi:hypothetical protein
MVAGREIGRLQGANALASGPPRGVVEARAASCSPELGIESDDVVDYGFARTWPPDREQRARIIGAWLQTKAVPRLVTEPRRFPPGPPRPASKTRTKPASARNVDAWLTVARRYAETEAGRAIAAVFAVAAVVILAGLAWLWLFQK